MMLLYFFFASLISCLPPTHFSPACSQQILTAFTATKSLDTSYPLRCLQQLHSMGLNDPVLMLKQVVLRECTEYTPELVEFLRFKEFTLVEKLVIVGCPRLRDPEESLRGRSVDGNDGSFSHNTHSQSDNDEHEHLVDILREANIVPFEISIIDFESSVNFFVDILETYKQLQVLTVQNHVFYATNNPVKFTRKHGLKVLKISTKVEYVDDHQNTYYRVGIEHESLSDLQEFFGEGVMGNSNLPGLKEVEFDGLELSYGDYEGLLLDVKYFCPFLGRVGVIDAGLNDEEVNKLNEVILGNRMFYN